MQARQKLRSVATPDGPHPDLASLSPGNRRLLERMMEAMAALEPQPGALRDLPQVTVEAGNLAKACRIAKESPDLNANQLLCLACVDFQDYFQLVYVLRSLGRPGPERVVGEAVIEEGVGVEVATMVIKGNIPYEEPRAPSVIPVWRAAEWYEREAHDLFGVTFDGHPDLAPLLLYDEFEGYPGRKEFPLNEYQEF